jgi:hypothetical protein
MFVYFITIWNILRPFGIIYGRLVQLAVIWYIFPIFVCLDQEKSGNPGGGVSVNDLNGSPSFSKILAGQMSLALHLQI